MRRSSIAVLALLIACGGRTSETTDSTGSGRASVQGNGEDDAAAGELDASGAGTAPEGVSGAACSNGAECKSGICFVGATRSFCSLRCTPASAAVVCAGPFEQHCNEMGYCRLAGNP
jgi:hypothetical protein